MLYIIRGASCSDAGNYIFYENFVINAKKNILFQDKTRLTRTTAPATNLSGWTCPGYQGKNSPLDLIC